jgi:hypothetical protein
VVGEQRAWDDDPVRNMHVSPLDMRAKDKVAVVGCEERRSLSAPYKRALTPMECAFALGMNFGMGEEGW